MKVERIMSEADRVLANSQEPKERRIKALESKEAVELVPDEKRRKKERGTGFFAYSQNKAIENGFDDTSEELDLTV